MTPPKHVHPGAVLYTDSHRVEERWASSTPLRRHPPPPPPLCTRRPLRRRRPAPPPPPPRPPHPGTISTTSTASNDAPSTTSIPTSTTSTASNDAPGSTSITSIASNDGGPHPPPPRLLRRTTPPAAPPSRPLRRRRQHLHHVRRVERLPRHRHHLTPPRPLRRTTLPAPPPHPPLRCSTKVMFRHRRPPTNSSCFHCVDVGCPSSPPLYRVEIAPLRALRLERTMAEEDWRVYDVRKSRPARRATFSDVIVHFVVLQYRMSLLGHELEGVSYHNVHYPTQ
ncbi:hypothetical protein DFP72DRAFT_275083 [Ephemerocybe angulata]|uniref:Uncharacterized protein n=1 Tax=Ephemerocybe angulata TaxID=980116 RepID=A0A8H6M6L4_9AGAR|nr:hypothetical protein DFP72DRAFT_275083 [Tulosesus angulatus]